MPPKKETPTKIASNQKVSDSHSFPIIGIGASAGGLEALEQFFQNVPKNCGMAFVVIQHLDPTHVGIMPELLQRTTQMKVVQATDHLTVRPNSVYVIPSNKSMSILNGCLFLFDPTEVRGLRLPIDYFFRSLADDQKEKSIGIVLSGMGSDGSLGLKAIKEQNGIVLVQDPMTAKFNGMPQSAIGAVVADIVADADELPEKLINFLKFTPEKIQIQEIEYKKKNNLEKIIILLRSQTGHDFSSYKKQTLFRRIERRMGVHQIDKIANYVRFLQENPKEIEILFKEFLIGVTNFFRDAAVWDTLKEKILPEMFKELPNGYTLRAWVIGCSTGEEAFSLAMIFNEAYHKIKSRKNLTLQIFATDIDKDAIDIARKGYYNPNIVADVSPERLSHFFTKEDQSYRINTFIREMVVFAPHNVIKDPPFTRLDLLTCRNLLIYIEPELQKKMMNLFYYSLNAEGTMLLGNAENENSANMKFTVIDSKLKLYKRSSVSKTYEILDLPSAFSQPLNKQLIQTTKPLKITENVQSMADQIVLQRFAPAGVLINPDGDILNITGRTGKYLEPAAGKANMNIYVMAREGLRNELPGAIRRALSGFGPVILRNIKIGTNGGTQIADITLLQIESPNAIRGSIMIIFSEVHEPVKKRKRTLGAGQSNATVREQELELEVQSMTEELQSTREEMQTAQEELKSTNEEMQSTNEELQSTNEELTTSREEMQSLNEELQTVNAELQSKINDYMASNSDMKNLLNSTDIATLFLDKNLNIRRFTSQLTKIFKMRQTDLGRPFTDMVTDLVYPDMTRDAQEVLNKLVFKETAIAANDHKWYLVRIMPYRSYDDRIDGLVITFIDISESKKMEAELTTAIATLKEHNLYQK